MAFKKLNVTTYPRRQWAIVGAPGSGKSTFAAQMAGPILVIDADHRFSEVAPLAGSDVFEISENPADHAEAERIAAQLKTNMEGSGVRTIIVDSLTAIIAPLTTSAVLQNDTGQNRNRVAAFKGKALALRLLQDAVTGTGVDTLWIYHTRSGLDGQARATVTTSISATELARLRRSLNMTLRVEIDNSGKRGITVEWARRGRYPLTLWDESGIFKDMPQRIERAVYDGLAEAERDAIERTMPTAFGSREDAIAWGFEQSCFRDAVHASNAYDKLKAEQKPQTAAMMWTLWIAEVQRRVAAGGAIGTETD